MEVRMSAKHVLLGVTGSIAAFKACQLASNLTKAGYEVRVAMTAAATQFVGPLTFDSLTHTPTRTTMFPESEYAQHADASGNTRLGISHIEDAKWADIVVVAPATANVIAKFATGIADDYLTSTVLAATCPKLVCPAMNVHIQQAISAILEDHTDHADASNAANALKQATTPVASDDLQSANPLDHSNNGRDLHGLKVLVTAGPTQEPLDPVRYLTNHSTGKMGYAIAQAARDRGAEVTLVSGPVALAALPDVRTIRVQTAQEMFEAMQAEFASADLTIMAAAVGDFRPVQASGEKIKKHGRTTITLELTSNPDILAWAGSHKRTDGSQAICGFAMETQHLIENAAKKLLDKQCDMLVANNLREPGAGFATDTNVVTILTPTAEQTADIEQLERMPKQELAGVILQRLNDIRSSHIVVNA